MRQHKPSVPIILVGTKSDIRDDPVEIERLAAVGQKPSTFPDGVALAEEIAAFKYVECSERDESGFDAVITAAIRAALTTKTTGEEGASSSNY